MLSQHDDPNALLSKQMSRDVCSGIPWLGSQGRSGNCSGNRERAGIQAAAAAAGRKVATVLEGAADDGGRGDGTPKFRAGWRTRVWCVAIPRHIHIQYRTPNNKREIWPRLGFLYERGYFPR